MEVYKKWKGIVYNSFEQCQITILSDSIEIKSDISGHFKNKVYSVTYLIKVNPNWETLFFTINSEVDKKINTISYSSDAKGNWYQNEKLLKEFSNCFDIDISLTPFTNTLPIKRLGLANNEEVILNILYIDILEGTQKQVHQKYKCISPQKYKYENVPNDFEAVITLDEDGFVADYPNLFNSI